MPVSPLYKSPNAKIKTARSKPFNLDNGNGTTVDDCILRHTKAISIVAGSAKVIYTDATSGTVAAGSIQMGTTVGGAEVIAATNYANSKAVGSTTSLTLISLDFAADTPLYARHTGVAATQAGEAYLQFEYMSWDD